MRVVFLGGFIDNENIKNLNFEKELRSKKLFINFLRSIIEHSRNHNSGNKINVFNDILMLLELKSVENFLYFRMLFDLVITNENITEENYDRRILIESAKRNFRTSERKSSFIDYIERYNLNDITKKFIKFRTLIYRQEKGFQEYDVFLSHKYTNKFYNFTLYFILKYVYNLKVYVDWIEHPNLNRRLLSKNTIDILASSLRKSKYLLFFNLDSNSTTTWMAWEVGYFKRLNKRVGIMDLGDYLKGRSNVEKLSSNDIFNVNNSNGIYETKSYKDIRRFVKEL